MVAALAGDLEDADRVELNLPETYACSVSGSATESLCADSCFTGRPKYPGAR
jgi:hypothetical protein